MHAIEDINECLLLLVSSPANNLALVPIGYFGCNDTLLVLLYGEFDDVRQALALELVDQLLTILK